jgi:hypothetical protein
LGAVAGVSDREAVCELPFSEAVTTAVRDVEIVPAVAVNVAVAALAATDTLAGTASAVVLLESVSVAPPLPAACERVAVHVDAPPLLRAAGLQETELNTAVATGATNSTDVICRLPFREAVRIAVWPADNVPVVAVKAAYRLHPCCW